MLLRHASSSWSPSGAGVQVLIATEKSQAAAQENEVELVVEKGGGPIELTFLLWRNESESRNNNECFVELARFQKFKF